MVREIRDLLTNIPFVPFRICMADGREYAVPTVDHIFLPPKQAREAVSDDEGHLATLPALLISGLIQETAASEQTPRA